MDGDPTPALTGRRRTRPTSIGYRKPRQPKPGRAPLIAAQAAVQTNRATSPISRTVEAASPRGDGAATPGSRFGPSGVGRDRSGEARMPRYFFNVHDGTALVQNCYPGLRQRRGGAYR